MISRQTFVLFINQIQSIFTRRTTFLNWNNSKFKKKLLSHYTFIRAYVPSTPATKSSIEWEHKCYIRKFTLLNISSFDTFLYMNMNLFKKTTLTHCPHIHVWRKVKLCKIARHEILKKTTTPLKNPQKAVYCLSSLFSFIAC